MLNRSILKSTIGYRKIKEYVSLFASKGVFLYLILSFALPAIGLYPMFGQGPASGYQITQFTTKDGLISNVCHDIVKDDKGFIWIASEGGLTRFDGKSFKVFGEMEGLTNQTIIHLRKSRDGQLWMHTIEGDVWVLPSNSDRVRLFLYDDTLKQILKGTIGFSRDHFYVDESNSIYLDLLGKSKAVKIDTTGMVTIISPKTGLLGTELYDTNDGVYFPVSYSKYEKKVITNFIDSIVDGDIRSRRREVIYCGNISYTILNDIEIEPAPGHMVFSLENDTIVHYGWGTLTVFTPDSVIGQIKSPRILDLKQMKDGSLIVGYHNKNGIRQYRSAASLLRSEFDVVMSGHSVTSICVDEDFSFWASTLNKGIFYFRNISLKHFLLKDGINCLETDRDSFIAYSGTREVSLINRFSQEEIDLDLTFNEVRNIEYSTQLGKLLIASNSSKYIDLQDVRNVYSLPFRRMQLSSDGSRKFREVPSDNKRIKVLSEDTIIAISSSHWLLFNRIDSFPVFNSFEQEVNEFRRFNDVVLFKDKIVFASDSGLISYTKGYYSEYIPGEQLSQARITELDLFKDRLIIGNHNKGVHVVANDSLVNSFSLRENFPGKYINRIFSDDGGFLFLCTDKGLVILGEVENALKVLYHVSASDGLYSNNVQDVCCIGDTIYIATDAGIQYLQMSEIKIDRRKVFIDYLNNHYIPGSGRKGFQIPFEDDIVISYTAIRPINDVFLTFRYRINNSDWVYVEDNEVRFSSLNPGLYNFEVCIQGDQGEWRDCETVSFLKLNIWYSTTWFRILLIAIGFGLVIYYFLWRIRLERRKRRTERQIMDLERKALNAQMNPHFIFNILNSIQSYIYFNDNKSAMKYLARFARLIRQSLVASSESSITLEQDMSMIENYLELEELRHKDRFTFSVKYNGARDPSTIRIPPMIIQPFVENAVFHGLKGVESGAQIDVIYTLQAEYVEVVIRDNGSGMTLDALDKEDSLGIKLTRQRLGLLNKPGVPKMEITSAPGQGTEVRVFISLAEVQVSKHLVRRPRPL